MYGSSSFFEKTFLTPLFFAGQNQVTCHQQNEGKNCPENPITEEKHHIQIVHLHNLRVASDDALRIVAD